MADSPVNDPKKLYREAFDRVEKVKREIPEQHKLAGIPFWHKKTQDELRVDLKKADLAAKSAESVFYQEKEHPPERRLQMREFKHSYESTSRQTDDEIHSRPRLFLEHLDAAGRALPRLVGRRDIQPLLDHSKDHSEDHP
ncbi:MAG: hypothetical protein KME42_08610 [Tildeniella nuda ZEHNDER 1965/U140]|jgi:hypothetical protein|nr:hypothetical protein [Tildeniella nuda ZEHNDER 1965/U140]